MNPCGSALNFSLPGRARTLLEQVHGAGVARLLIEDSGVSMAPKHEVLIIDTGRRFQCSEDQNLLRGMEQIGVRGIPVGCRGGGCGICKVQVVSGRYRTERMSRACITEEEEQHGIALACRLFPAEGLSVRVIGKIVKMLYPANPQ
jgi:ferredoxin